MPNSPGEMTAVELAVRLHDGRLTALELTRSLLGRIQSREPTVRAWAHLDPALALSRAAACDQHPPAGPLHGIPIGVKDIIDTADEPTEHGSPIHAGRRPAADAAIVADLQAAGAVVMGKTVTTEFALFHPGPTTNPHDPRRTPGGSSSGSAAAVAAGMVPLALGTQTAGSIVRPASFCGIAGWKPTWGTLPLDGVLLVASSLDTLGVFARDVAGLRHFATAMTDLDLDLPVPRIGFAPTAQWAALDPGTREVLTALVTRLGLPTVVLPPPFAGLADAQASVMAHEAAQQLGPQCDLGPVSQDLSVLLDAGRQVTSAEHEACLALAARCRDLLPGVLAEAGVDVLLTPAVLGEAPVGLGATGDPLCCRAWTLLGGPCVAVPGLKGPAGMPLGVQVVATPGADGLALAGAAHIEAALADSAGPVPGAPGSGR